MAGKYLGPAFDIHGGGVDLRFPHHENEQAQSRAAGRPFASYWLHNAWITTAGEKMSKSLGNSLLIPSVLERVRGIELRYYMVAAHYRSHVEFCFEALDEAAKGVPPDRGLPRPGGRRGRHVVRGAARRLHRRRWTTTSAPRRPSRSSTTRSARATGCSPTAPSDELSQKFGEVIAMLDVLGLNPADAAWATGGRDDKLDRTWSTPWCRGCWPSGPQRARPRTGRAPTPSATRSRQPASRSRTPRRTTWTEVGACDMAGNSKRKGAIKKTGKGNPTAGSGGRVRRGLEGRGPTPKAKRAALPPGAQGAPSAPRRPRPRRPKRRTTSDAEWAAGRNSVVELLRGGVPVTAIYVAEGAERDNRLREAFKLAAEQGVKLLEVTRNEMDRMTSGAVHQGLAARLPAYEYAHADDLLDRADEAKEPALIVALDSVTDPRNLGAVVRSAAGFGAHGVLIPERRAAGMTASAWKTSAGAAARLRSPRPST